MAAKPSDIVIKKIDLTGHPLELTNKVLASLSNQIGIIDLSRNQTHSLEIGSYGEPKLSFAMPKGFGFFASRATKALKAHKALKATRVYRQDVEIKLALPPEVAAKNTLLGITLKSSQFVVNGKAYNFGNAPKVKDDPAPRFANLTATYRESVDSSETETLYPQWLTIPSIGRQIDMRHVMLALDHCYAYQKNASIEIKNAEESAARTRYQLAKIEAKRMHPDTYARLHAQALMYLMASGENPAYANFSVDILTPAPWTTPDPLTVDRHTGCVVTMRPPTNMALPDDITRNLRYTGCTRDYRLERLAEYAGMEEEMAS